MTVKIPMPALSPTMTEGTLTKWLIKVGDQVKAGDVLAEIETDKATMEVEAVDEGKVAKLIVEEGTSNIPVNSTIAILDGDDKDQNEGDQDQTKDTVGKIKKKEILDNDKTFKLPNENKNSTETVSNFDNLISLCLKHKEMQLKYDLEKNVSLVKFSNGQMEFSFNENIDKNFIKNLSKKLFVWTGKRWIITLSKEKGQPTHQEIKLEKKQTQLDEAIKTNAYKKMLEAFSDAKLITVEENEKKK